jgi:hypothetical protein
MITIVTIDFLFTMFTFVTKDCGCYLCYHCYKSYECSSVAMLTLICQECLALRTFPVLFILVSCNTSLIRPLNCTNRNVPHLFLAIGCLQSVYSRQWLVTISECTLLDLSVTRLPCSLVESFKSLIYLILCLYLDFLPK